MLARQAKQIYILENACRQKQNERWSTKTKTQTCSYDIFLQAT